MSTYYPITVADFTRIFGWMSDRLAKKIQAVDLGYITLSKEQRDDCIRRIVLGLMTDQFEVVGEHRRERWEEGWSKNLEALKAGEAGALTPYYFRHDQIARWRQEFVMPQRAGFDRDGLSIIMEWLFEKHMSQTPAVYEFGCGTGHHLLQLREVNPAAKLCGLDWSKASQKIIAEMVHQGKLSNAVGRNFDFFNPDQSLDFEDGAVVYTVGALEQVGDRHAAFVDFLREKKPALVVHVEPIAEVLDPGNLVDYLAILYFQKRGYLSGLLDRLYELEEQEQVRLHDVRRTFLGGNMYVDHYTVVVWSPIP